MRKVEIFPRVGPMSAFGGVLIVDHGGGERRLVFNRWNVISLEDPAWIGYMTTSLPLKAVRHANRVRVPVDSNIVFYRTSRLVPTVFHGFISSDIPAILPRRFPESSE